MQGKSAKETFFRARTVRHDHGPAEARLEFRPEDRHGRRVMDVGVTDAVHGPGRRGDACRRMKVATEKILPAGAAPDCHADLYRFVTPAGRRAGTLEIQSRPHRITDQRVWPIHRTAAR